jgi:hypothetical protein
MLDSEWRFAVSFDAGFPQEGVLVSEPSEKPEAAQAGLLRMVQNETGYEYLARWASPQPNYWAARLKVRHRPGYGML